MKENVSSGGTLGLGLPGTKRLVDDFEIDSAPGRGTRVRIVKWS
jgi:serine/threonine-protein kinase RsbT